MAYNRNPAWQDWPNKTTPITSVELENIEEGIVDAANQADSAIAALPSKSDVGHIHDDRYYTESEVDSFLSGKVPKGSFGYNVKDYGAVGDGVADDTSAIQSALDTAASTKLPVFIPAGTYNVTTLLPKAGVRIISRGATLKATATAGEGMIATTLGTAVDDWGVDGLTFDCNGLGKRAVFVKGSRVVVRNNRVFGLTAPDVTVQAIRLYWDSMDCTIENNDITLGIDQPTGTFASLIGINVTGSSVSSYAGLDTSNDVVPATNMPLRNIIRGNRVTGGTHGIALMGTEQNIVQGNYCEKQTHRNILLSPQASYNDVSGNVLRQFGSAAVHMAYGSSGNHVHGNSIFSDGTFMFNDTTGGEGAIQAYIHCQDNRIEGNHIRTKSTRTGIYVAIYCNGTAIENNDIEWTRQTGITVQSDWLATPAAGENYTRPNYNAPFNPAWTSWDNGKGMTQISVRGNRIRRSQLGIVNAGIYIAQVGTSNLSNVTVDNNLIDSQNTSGHDLYVYVADATKFTASSIDRNVVQPNEVLHITFYNTATKLTSYANNSWQGRIYNVAGGTTVVDWSVSDNRVQNAADTITSFTGLMMDPNFYGRTFAWKMFAGGKVNHGSGITLKGAVQATATTSNDTIVFKVVNGNAVEISRNF